MPEQFLVGCAGWALRTECQGDFPGTESHLIRYAWRFNAVEINSSFYRPHRAATYRRWAASVPDDFCFSLKLPRVVTHELRLLGTESELDRFLGDSAGLGGKRRCILVQLPPSLEFQECVAGKFLETFRSRCDTQTVLEARHATWFTAEADIMLDRFRLSRVSADPPVAGDDDRGARPYFRMHGTPRIYYSEYSRERLEVLADELIASAASGTPAWCIFDNTALGHAIPNALALQEALVTRAAVGRPEALE